MPFRWGQRPEPTYNTGLGAFLEDQMGRRSVLVIVCLTVLSGATCVGQSIVINRLALLQTRLIQTAKSVGTAFAVNVDDREYWITAKHILTGIENAPPGVFTTT